MTNRKEEERQTIERGTAVWKRKKNLELLYAAIEKKQNWEMLALYNPWGKPGHGAPMPGALRKTKWTLENSNEEVNPKSVMTLGRPGHGAPLRSSTGKLQAVVKYDPLIRFQMHNLARGAVENNLRYKSNQRDKENYRKELEAIISQQKRTKLNSEAFNSDDQKLVLYPDEANHSSGKDNWGRPGPGGKIWRNPNRMGRNFFTSMGWSNDKVLKKLQDKHAKNELEQMYAITGGGVELVPLLAKHRMVTTCPLSTTDITRISRICNKHPKMDTTVPGYFQQLCQQIDEKEKQKIHDQKEDEIQSHKHFETWKGFWGRPGHGAPKALSQRKKLEVLLNHMPSRRMKS